MNNIKLLVCIIVMIFLVVTSVIKIMISLNYQSATSFEIDEVNNNVEESTNSTESTESIRLFYGKFYVTFHNWPCVYQL